MLGGDVLRLGVAERPDLVGLNARGRQTVNAPSWYSAHAAARSTSNLVPVFFAAPVTRTVARMLMPSTRQPTIRTRCSVLNLSAIPTIMPDQMPLLWLFSDITRQYNRYRSSHHTLVT